MECFDLKDRDREGLALRKDLNKNFFLDWLQYQDAT